MRAAPNYIPGQAINGYWKQELLIFLGKEFNIHTLVETGTCDGGTLNGVYKDFFSCYSIELSEYYYNISKEKFKCIDNISLIQGNSAEKLYELLLVLNVLECPRILFWLDAHSSGGKTANDGDPLPEEIKAIVELSPDSLVVIDDHNSADEVKNKCLENDIDLTGWTLEFRTGIVFLYRNGLYKIPEFE